MTLRCARESEVLEAVRNGRWPAALDPALRSHVDTCDQCAQLVLLASTLQETRHRDAAAAKLPPPGLIFWRAQLYRRNRALQKMTRPVVLAEVIALILSVAALLVSGAQWLRTADFESAPGIGLLQVVSSALDVIHGWPWFSIFGALVALGAFAAVAFYLVAIQD